MTNPYQPPQPYPIPQLPVVAVARHSNMTTGQHVFYGTLTLFTGFLGLIWWAKWRASRTTSRTTFGPR